MKWMLILVFKIPVTITQYTNVKTNLDRHIRLLKKDMVSKYEVENLELSKIHCKHKSISDANCDIYHITSPSSL